MHEGGLALARWLQEHLAWLTPVMAGLTHLGDEEFYVLVFPLLYWSVHRSLGLRMGVLLLLSAGLNAGFKLGFRTARPSFLDPDLAIAVETSFGIPSGHAQNGVAVWGLLAAATHRRWVWAAAVALIAGIGWSRVHLGAHFVEDVVIGWAVGGVLLVVFLRVEPRATAWLAARPPGTRVLAAFAASAVLVGVGATAQLALLAWEVPEAWVGAGALGDPDSPVRLADVVTASGALFGLGVGVVALDVTGGFAVAGVWWRRALRYPLGLGGVAVLWLGLGAVLPGGETPGELALRYGRYALVGAWIAGGAPWLFVRLRLAQATASSTRSGMSKLE